MYQTICILAPNAKEMINVTNIIWVCFVQNANLLMSRVILNALVIIVLTFFSFVVCESSYIFLFLLMIILLLFSFWILVRAGALSLDFNLFLYFVQNALLFTKQRHFFGNLSVLDIFSFTPGTACAFQVFPALSSF
jgi:hypothetical protein